MRRFRFAFGFAVSVVAAGAAVWALFWIPAQFLTAGWWLLWVTFTVLLVLGFVLAGEPGNQDGGW